MRIRTQKTLHFFLLSLRIVSMFSTRQFEGFKELLLIHTNMPFGVRLETNGVNRKVCGVLTRGFMRCDLHSMFQLE